MVLFLDTIKSSRNEFICTFSVAIAIAIYFMKSCRVNNDQDSLQLRRCPNPNCIRCQKYEIVQQSAKKRLPHLIRHIDGSEDTSKVGKQGDGEVWRVDKTEVATRVMKGVQLGPPPLPSSISKKFYYPLLKLLPTSYTKNSILSTEEIEKNWSNSLNQYPTVLFIPKLLVAKSSHLTIIHEKACAILKTNSIINGKERANVEILMDEYVESQFNGGEWHTNDSSPSVSTKEEKSQANESGSEDSSSAMPQWEVLYLMNQGQWIDSNIKRCPQTHQLLQKIPSHDLMAGCMFGNIFFSVLYPGTRIDIHCGPTNVRHRFHFPLVVPQKKESKRTKNQTDYSKSIPFLKVDDETLHWVEGEPFVFDDSLAHSAEYPDGDDQSVRVVLVVDLWHKDLTKKERGLIQSLYPSEMPVS